MKVLSVFRGIASTAATPSQTVRRITVVPEDEKATATHVIKCAAAGLYVRLAQGVSIGELRQFCIDQRGWNVSKHPVVVDGKMYSFAESNAVPLSPTTRTIEFAEKTGMHG